EGGVLTTDEICRGVKAKHAQLHALLPPRWQEEVRQILEAHCISHEGNSWFLENIEQLVRQLLEAYRSSHEGSRFLEIDLHHGTSELIINDSNRGQKRTDWASTESYRYLDLALPEYVARYADGIPARHQAIARGFSIVPILLSLPRKWPSASGVAAALAIVATFRAVALAHAHIM